MLPKDYIAYKMTGVHSCDYSDASGMLLLDVKNKCWSKEMMEICDVKKNNFQNYLKVMKQPVLLPKMLLLPLVLQPIVKLLPTPVITLLLQLVPERLVTVDVISHLVLPEPFSFPAKNLA